MEFRRYIGAALALTTAVVLGATAAQATTLKITITNNQTAGGLSATPVYSAFHDGSFDAFTVGEAASPGVELIAELGMVGGLPSERLASDPNSTATVVASPSGPPPLQPGETAFATIDVDPLSNRFFTYLSMVLPSNDTFIGNDNPLAYEIFDSMGNFLGPQIIHVTGLDFFDAGTEVNDAMTGPAFVAMQDATLGTVEGGVVSKATSLAEFAGLTLATGDVLGSAGLIDFTTNPAGFNFLTISIEDISQVPLPAGAPLFLMGLMAFALQRRRQTTA